MMIIIIMGGEEEEEEKRRRIRISEYRHILKILLLTDNRKLLCSNRVVSLPSH
jgi:hypothetical protein